MYVLCYIYGFLELYVFTCLLAFNIRMILHQTLQCMNRNTFILKMLDTTIRSDIETII